MSEEQQEEIRLRQHRSRVAKKILGDKDIMEVFSDMKAEHHEAFDSMGYGTTLENYQTVHFSLIALSQLIARLEMYILDNEMAEENEEMDKDMEGVQV